MPRRKKSRLTSRKGRSAMGHVTTIKINPEIWNHFIELKENGKLKGICNFCGKICNPVITNLCRHVVSCDLCPREVKETAMRRGNKTANRSGSSIAEQELQNEKTEVHPDIIENELEMRVPSKTETEDLDILCFTSTLEENDTELQSDEYFITAVTLGCDQLTLAKKLKFKRVVLELLEKYLSEDL